MRLTTRQGAHERRKTAHVPLAGDLASFAGIEQVTVDVATRRVRIAYDQQQTSPDQLRALLDKIGYPAAP